VKSLVYHVVIPGRGKTTRVGFPVNEGDLRKLFLVREVVAYARRPAMLQIICTRSPRKGDRLIRGNVAASTSYENLTDSIAGLTHPAYNGTPVS